MSRSFHTPSFLNVNDPSRNRSTLFQYSLSVDDDGIRENRSELRSWRTGIGSYSLLQHHTKLRPRGHSDFGIRFQFRGDLISLPYPRYSRSYTL